MTNKAFQKPSVMMGYPAKRWQKLAYKAPMLLWRLGLGPLIGRIIIVITTTGNKSKLPRHNMAEYYVLPDTIFSVRALPTS